MSHGPHLPGCEKDAAEAQNPGAGLRAHGEGNADVAEMGCGALSNLASDDDIAVAIRSAGGVEVIVSALRAQCEI